MKNIDEYKTEQPKPYKTWTETLNGKEITLSVNTKEEYEKLLQIKMQIKKLADELFPGLLK